MPGKKRPNNAKRKGFGFRGKILVSQGGCCYWCKRQVGFDKGRRKFLFGGKRQATVDHRVPRWRGGSDSRENIVIACLQCNQERSLDAPSHDYYYQQWLEIKSMSSGRY